MSQEPVIDPIAPVMPPRLEPTGQPVALIDLRPEHCRWPLWANDEQANLLFCGAINNGSSSYCASHAKRAYTAAKPR